jgi:hypothetical protein
MDTVATKAHCPLGMKEERDNTFQMLHHLRIVHIRNPSALDPCPGKGMTKASSFCAGRKMSLALN